MRRVADGAVFADDADHLADLARAVLDTTQCSTRTSLFIAGDLTTGQIDFSHAHARSVDLNAFQFAAFVSREVQPSWSVGSGGRRLTQQRCHEDFVDFERGARPVLRVVWCARAYRELDGLYDVSILAVTQDRAREALISRLAMRGVTYDNALALGRHLDALTKGMA